MTEGNPDPSFIKLGIHLRELQSQKRLVRLRWNNKMQEAQQSEIPVTPEGIDFAGFAFELGESQGEINSDMIWLQTLAKLGLEGHIDAKTALLLLETKDEIRRNNRLV